jgi:DNA-binding response OmpR family regulator
MGDAASTGKAYKILLIEDEDFLRRIFKSRLVGEGYDVIDVGSAEKALDFLLETAPDLIILDLYLPQMNGFDFLKCLKASPAREHIPVLILSGLGQEADIRKGLKLGAQEFVIKTNVKPPELLNKIRLMLAGKGEGPHPPR